MAEDLKRLAQTFRLIAEAYQLLAMRLNGESNALHTTAIDLKDYATRLEANLTEPQNEALSQLAQHKTEVLAEVVREVRIGLTALKAALYVLLQEERADPETRRTLLTRTQQIVEQLMDLMRQYFLV